MSPAYREILSRAKLCARELGVYAPVKVLLVENDENLSSEFSAFLRRSNRATFEVCCTRMYQAVEQIREQKHDIYVLDAACGQVGGLEVVKMLHDEGLHFPFIIVTAEGSLHRKAMGEDCMGYFQKPFSGDELAVALLDALKNYTRCCAMSISPSYVARPKAA